MTIIEQLRMGFGGMVPPVCDDAANEIERLTEQAAIDKDFIEQYQVEVSELKEFLKGANCALRSAAEVAQRDGKATNWDAFRSRLATVLLSQHKYLYPVSGSQEKTCAGCGIKWNHDSVWCRECALKRVTDFATSIATGEG